MSTTIDEKVVEMRFDNRDFEKNIKDTMKTLDEFKKQLNFSGASDGLDNIAKQANKLNFNSLNNAINVVNERFSVLGIMGVTALQNITNSAINTGKRLVSALTIDPVRTGFREYEQKMDAVRVIVASTGEDLDVVNKKIQELNKYADDTIYSFSDMTLNIGKFTNAGVKLDDAVLAIKGVSNEAARSGATANEASRAMYNFAQALSMGYVQLIDWKSIENANMATVEFKKELLKTAISMHTVTEAANDMYTAGDKTYNLQQMFKDGLKEEWLTSNVLIETLKRYADENTDFGRTMYDAARQVSTVSKLWDTLKEAAQSGWGNTWEILVGDLEQSKKVLTRISDFISGIIGTISDARNNFLKKVLDPINPLLQTIGDSSKAIIETVDAVKDYVDVVDDIISGKWGNGQSRWDKLTAAGYDWAHAQNLVNEKLGSSVRHATNFSEAQDEIINSENKVVSSTAQYIESLSKMDDATLLSTLGDEKKVEAVREIQRQADRLGLSVSELVDKSNELSGRTLIIESFANIGNSLVKIFESVGKAWKAAFPPLSADTVYDIIAGLYKFSNVIKNYVNDNAEKLTRTLKGLFSVLSVVANIVKGVLRVGFTALKAIMALFGKTTSGVLDVTASLGDILVLISNVLNDKIVWVFDKIISLMEFAINVIKDFITNNESLVNAFNWVKDGIYNAIGSIKDYLSNNEKLNKAIEIVKSNISSLIDKIKDWFKNTDIINNISKTLTENITKVSKAIKDWYDNNERLQTTFQNIKDGIDKAKTSLKEWFESFSGDNGIGKNIIDGIANGLKYGVSKIIEAIKSIASKIISTFCNIFGIHSPSTLFYGYGVNIIDGLINGISNMIPKLKNIFSTISEKIGKHSFGDIANVLWRVTDLVPQLAFLKLPMRFLNLFTACGVQSVQGLKDGLTKYGGIAIDAIKNLANTVIKTFKSILGIASPSKVFIAIGGFIIAGLALGLKQGFLKIPDTIRGFALKIIDIFKAIDFGKIIAVLVTGGIFLIAYKLVGALKIIGTAIGKFGDVAKNVTAPLKGLGDALTGIGHMFTDKGKAERTRANSEAVRNIALSIALMAASIYIISKVNRDDLLRSVGVIAGLLVAMTALFAFTTWFSGKFAAGGIKNIFQFQKPVDSLIKIAGSILLLALAIKLISKIDLGENAARTFGMLTTIIGIFMLMLGMAAIAGQNAAKAGTMLLEISIAMLIIVKVMKSINEISNIDASRGLIVITMIAGIFAALIIVSSVAGKFSKKSGMMILKIASAIALMVIVIKLLARISDYDLSRGLVVISMISGIFMSLIIVSAFMGQFSKSAGLMLLEISAAIVLIIGAIKLLASIENGDLVRGMVVISIIGIIFAAIVHMTWVAGNNAVKAGAMLLEMSVALLVVVGALFLLTKIDDKDLWRSVGIIAILEALFGGLIAVSHIAGDAKGTIIALSIAIGVLVAGLAILTLLDPDKLDHATLCISLVISMMAVLVASTHLAPDLKKSLGTMAVLIAALTMITIALAVLSGVNSEDSLRNAMAISEILIAMSISMVLLSKIQQISFKALGAMAILGLIVLEIGAVLGILQHFNVKPSIETATALSILLVSMSGCLLILSAVGMTGAAAITGALQLVAIIGIIGLILVAIGALVEKFPKIEEFINKGGDIFGQIGSILGDFIGNFVAGIAGPLIDLLPKIGQKLSEFMIALTPFLVGVKLVDSNTLKGASFLALAILEMTAAELISGIASFVTGGHPLSDLGKELTAFMVNASPFFMMLQMIGPETVNSVKNLAEAILAITKAEFVQGINNFLGFGDKSLAGFGEQLSSLGSGLNGFVKELTDFSPEKVEIVNSACEAIKSLAEANKSIPNSGGLLANIIGDNTLDVFGNSLESLGKGLNSFISNIKDFSNDSVEKVKAACESIKLIADANNSIPNTGGLVSMIIGDNDLGDFGSDLESLGNGLSKFLSSLANFDIETGPQLVKAACDSIAAIAGLNSNLKENDWYSKLLGKTDLQKFSEQIPLLGEGINSFVQKLADFTSEKVIIVQTAVDALLAIGSLGALDLSNIATNMVYFSGALSDLGVGMATFFNTLTEIGLETIQDGINKVDQLIAMASTIAETNIEQVSVFSDSLVKVANDGVMGFCNAFEGVIPKEKAKQAVVKMLISALSGAVAMKPLIIKEFNAIAEGSVTALRSYYQAFFDAGRYLSQGFADGITDNSGAAIAAAAEMGRRAAEALRNATDEHSPSKITEEIGNYFGEGLVIGIRDYFGKVYNTAFNAGDMAKEGLSNAIAKISQMVEDGINTSPTIRPVLDLSEVEQGAAYLGSMFGTNSVGLRENINSISNRFNSRIQNGSGLDLLNAINKLETTVRGSNGNTLNIYTQELDSEKLDQIVRHVNKELGVIF